jgi:chromosome segregation ATPase
MNANLWALRAAAFGRMVARTHAHGGAPAEIVQDLERMWRLVATAATVEAEAASEMRALEALERRGREFRAQAGRKIEDLARAESHLRRTLGEARQHVDELETRQQTARDDLARAEISIRSLTRRGSSLDHAQFRAVAELSGAAKASIDETEQELLRQRRSMQEMTVEKEQLEKQIHQSRALLGEQTDAYELQLRQARSQLAERARDSQRPTNELERVSADMTGRLRARPDCLTLLEELPLLESQVLSGPG